ncbi:T9SS type B sorting domain-containing protein [Flavilitoribacter nigricans]|uniref:T9SS type B sorting domain-containing protein n=1 Tax=Flavilitoribacter nigricans (strain ATCC 23147 / DSM 23189 / NBRC 102662 / NCIMB 1420 / SS-2) TaxID=1122177 RepID=A0A2D0N5V8_FLAN2|nr:gliding motility-associated C-terminal domain-containing protein [Flavilitoribacter nigricans]PHN03884.1 hypothetical protein CRP01_23710 [Flavilitoribacter nigricans DSM 23189 = NBRC 102662]
MNSDFKHLGYRSIFQIAILIAFLFPLSSPLQAQINAPEFLCVQNDTLRWNTPVNNCGTFNGYLIYSSQDITGPYDVLDTVTNQNQSSYYHDGAGNQTWYYYLESDLECAGEPILRSDTLDNRIPDAGPIRLVTVEDETTVRVEWTPSPSPEVIGYIVSRQNALGTTILDTIYDSLVYTDLSAGPGERPETYFVVALDPCGNVSLVPDPHQTIFTEIVSVDSCSQEVNLRWTEYINWPEGVERYEILVSETLSGTPGPYMLAGAVEGTVNTFTFPATNDGSLFCFKVQAVAAGSGDMSLSNETCVEVGVVQAVRDLVVTNLEVAPESVTVNWVLEPDVPLRSATLFRSDNGSDFSPLTDIMAEDEQFLDMTALANSGPLTYRIEAEDQCGNMIVSNAASTIYLSGSTGDNSENVLNWTPYANEAGQVSSYEVYRIMGASETFEATYSESGRTHVDPVDLTDPSQAALCYYVVSNEEVALSGQSITVQSVSNVVCLEQSAKLFVPNAFVPNGVNREFKPVLQFGGSQEYLMTIYDRYGGIIFESQDLSIGWDGRKNGRPLPQGMYVYLIKMKQNSGQLIEKKGTVLLLR